MKASLYMIFFGIFFFWGLYAEESSAQAEVRNETSAELLLARIEHPIDLKEDPGPSPSPDYMWVKGHWRWNDVQWIWVSGRWIPRPSQDAQWVPGYWFRKHHH